MDRSACVSEACVTLGFEAKESIVPNRCPTFWTRPEVGGDAWDRCPVPIHEEDVLAHDGLPFDGQGKVHAPIDQHLKEQVFGRAVRLDVVGVGKKVVLFDGIGRVVHVLHVGRVDLQDAEAGVEVGGVGEVFGFELSSCPSNSLFTNLRYRFESRLPSNTFLGAMLWKLNHNMSSCPLVSRVHRHQRMCSGG